MGACLFLFSLLGWRGVLSSAGDYGNIYQTKPDHESKTKSGLRIGELHDYEIVVPTTVDTYGHFVSYDLSVAPMTSSATGNNEHRRKRSADTAREEDDADPVFYKLSAYGEEFRLSLTRNDALVSGDYFSEEWDDTGVVRRPGVRRRCHYVGNIANISASRVAISNCHGLHGVFATRSEEYIVEPLERGAHKQGQGQHDRSHGQPHIVYKLSALKQAREDDSSPCGVRDKERHTIYDVHDWWMPKHEPIFNELIKQHPTSTKHHRPMKHDSKSLPRWRRSVSRERYVETLVVVDKFATGYHGLPEIEEYVLTLMNIVAELFRDASIGNAVNIVVSRVIILTGDKPEFTVSHHAGRTLGSFCRWQKTVVDGDGEDAPGRGRHDTAVLLTRFDICAEQNRPCGTLGLASVGGMCNPDKSCALVEDIGLASAFTVAHEMGHSFGMQHDGFGNKCGGKSVAGIMASQLTENITPFAWSNCSQDYIISYLDSGFGECLNNRPGKKSARMSTEALPGEKWNGTEQCRLQYGPRSTQCKYGEVCRELWCIGRGQRCVTDSIPAADGTNCSQDGVKVGWCYKGRCVKRGWRPHAVNGGWTEWSTWSECSRTCGGGVRSMRRQCVNPNYDGNWPTEINGNWPTRNDTVYYFKRPGDVYIPAGPVSQKPAHGGRFCTGQRQYHRSCNIQDCPKNATDFRSLQCREFDKVAFRGQYHRWVPYTGGDVNQCALNCLAVGYNFYTEKAQQVVDGTRCRADKLDICISGVCQHVGCDRILGSKLLEDKCRLCGGSGDTCRTIVGTFMKRKSKGTYQQIMVIPQGSINIVVQEVVPSRNYIALKSLHNDKFYINGKWTIDWPHSFDVVNTKYYYERPDKKREILRSQGPTTTDVAIMSLLQEENKGIRYEYSVPLATNGSHVTSEHTWHYLSWSTCSATCGGASERSIQVLHNADSHSHAEGQSSVRTSEADCVRRAAKDTTVKTTLCHAHLRPPTYAKTCNDKPCPPQWRSGAWSACTRSCGGGMRERVVVCMRRVNQYKDEVMEQSACPRMSRPATRGRCHTKRCPPVWIKSHWSLCSPRCGPGVKKRNVYCMTSDRSRRLPHRECRRKSPKRPPHKLRCYLRKCPPPIWRTGAWTKCTAACGKPGKQRRNVVCHTHAGKPSNHCNLKKKPANQQRCRGLCDVTKPSKECKDVNKVGYCPLVLKYRFCNRLYFQQMCCQTCRKALSGKDHSH